MSGQEPPSQAESHKWVCHILKNIHDTCFTPNFSREIDWEWSQICQRPPSHAHRRQQRQPGRVLQVGTSTKTTSGSTTASLSNLPKTYMTHVLYPIFQEKSTENGLRYVRGVQVKLIDGDNVNQAKYHKWVRHIFKNKHNTCLISNFSREIDWE